MTEVSPEIIRRCKGGDVTALEAIYRCYGSRVFGLALKLMGSHADAEDATQQIFLRVFRQVSKFGGQAALSTWLYRVATNHCLNLLSSRRSHAPLSELNSTAACCNSVPPGHDVARSEDADALQSLLERLAPDERALIVLKEVHGLTYRELALVLDIPAGTVMSRMHRARERLTDTAQQIFRDDSDWRRDGVRLPVQELEG